LKESLDLHPSGSSFLGLTLLGALAACTLKHPLDPVDALVVEQEHTETLTSQVNDGDTPTWERVHFTPLNSPPPKTPIPPSFQLRATPDYFQSGLVDEEMKVLSLRVARCVLEYGDLARGDAYFGIQSYYAELTVMPMEGPACWSFFAESANKSYLNPVDSLSYVVYNQSCDDESGIVYSGVDHGLNGRPNYGRHFRAADMDDVDILPGQQGLQGVERPMDHLDYHTDVLEEALNIGDLYCTTVLKMPMP
jgi:hypothetical protein